MIGSVVYAAVVASAFVVQGKEPQAERFDFEGDEPGKAPAGWNLTTPGYEVIVSPEKARQGKHSVRIRATEKKPGRSPSCSGRSTRRLTAGGRFAFAGPCGSSRRKRTTGFSSGCASTARETRTGSSTT